jgi:hypothetical protein
MAGSADYSLVTGRKRRLVCAEVRTAQTSRRYQNRKCTAPLQLGVFRAQTGSAD